MDAVSYTVGRLDIWRPSWLLSVPVAHEHRCVCGDWRSKRRHGQWRFRKGVSQHQHRMGAGWCFHSTWHCQRCFRHGCVSGGDGVWRSIPCRGVPGVQRPKRRDVLVFLERNCSSMGSTRADHHEPNHRQRVGYVRVPVGQRRLPGHRRADWRQRQRLRPRVCFQRDGHQ
jgi:hypothetical protein